MATEVANSSVAIAMAFAGRSARACDVCANKSAHWFCAADDAYLCTACDTQVHSANALSLRHERVRLSATGTPLKASSKPCGKVPESEERQHRPCGKKLHPSPPQVAPVRKRSRTSRPYSQHLQKLTQVVKSEDHHHHPQSELELFDFLDGDEFVDQEVPCMATVVPSPDSSELDFLSSPESPESFHDGDHSASADSFAAFFKSKAAHSHDADGDQFLVPDTFVDGPSSPEDSDLANDAFFFPGDIPGLGGFDSFVPEMDLSDDFSLSFDLALQNNHAGVEACGGDQGRSGLFPGEITCKTEQLHPVQPSQPDQFSTGPFAKFFATKTKAELMAPMSPDRIASQAKEMLHLCCTDADADAQRVPTLQLNLGDVLTAWSGRGDVWINPNSEDSNITSSGASDAGVVPDMDAAAAGEEHQSGANRDARVMRYKEKRRTRLFSKKIRYEVRKLNAERRPRMKGRFVKRTPTTPAS